MARPTKREQTNKKISEALSKMTPETLALLKQAFAVDATVEEACFYANIHPATFYRWKEKNPELSEEIERLRLTPILKARQTIIAALGNTATAQWFIERKRADEFAPKSKVEHGGKIETQDTTTTEAVQAVVTEYETKLREAIAAGHKKP